MNFKKLTSRNCLFLICPSDHMESILNQSFNCRAFFYMALGANFNWDVKTQENLINFIKDQEIEEVIFIVKVTNLFYKKTLKFTDRKISFPLEKALIKPEYGISSHYKNQKNTVSKLISLASYHLQKQKKHLLSTFLLGKVLRKNDITVKGFVYDPDYKTFYTPLVVEQKKIIYGKLPLN
ncbi:hypothetical protein [Aquimarina sp. I32.4]|uniref:hypothetical protein n=1 Tax=Aquimarina sp. I32.4 TaxID=2053903 RepID=UPI0013049DA4|nr:hypothetical protein [Aquimarina sp. I32.4]